MTTFPSPYGCSADTLICSIEAADHRAHTTAAPRGRYLLPLLQVLTGAAVVLARRVEVLNR